MNGRFLAACLYVMAALTLYATARAVLKARRTDPAMAVMAVIFAAFFSAVLVNAGVDLW